MIHTVKGQLVESFANVKKWFDDYIMKNYKEHAAL